MEQIGMTQDHEFECYFSRAEIVGPFCRLCPEYPRAGKIYAFWGCELEGGEGAITKRRREVSWQHLGSVYPSRRTDQT